MRLTELRQGECDAVLGEVLDRYESQGVKFGPALAFLDQFGYSAVSLNLIKRILQFPSCEAFVYLDYKNMNRWITDPSKAVGFTRTYGGEEWREAIHLPEAKRREFLLTTYKNALRARGNAKYVLSFSMFNKTGTLLYWLVFCTGNLRGLEEMKKAMWYVDKTGAFRFSDQDDPTQVKLLEDSFDQNWLADELRSKLAGKTMTVADVAEYVLTDTPCYLFKEALRILESDSGEPLTVLNPPVGRRRGTFLDEKMQVRFPSPGLFS